MADLNAPFACSCNGRLFHHLKRYNVLCCELETDPETAPLVIECADCGRRFEQTTDRAWKPITRWPVRTI
jgi:hypothetical protein